MVARKRGATGLSGVLLVDKPAGFTSHDVVAKIRRATGEGRVGHAGTLDPMATGLLVVLVGPATRLEPYLSSAQKRYDAQITFGSATDTDDAAGEIVREAPVSAETADTDYARGVLEGLLGESLQQPPAYSAIKVGGTTAHRAARSGAPLELAKRPITVEAAELLSIESDPTRWDVAFIVSKGTYIRSLARDIGEAVGSAAHLSALRRTASGPLDLADAHSLDDVVAAAESGALGALWADPVAALGVPAMGVEPAAITDGRPLARTPDFELPVGTLVALTGTSPAVLLALYRATRDRLVPEAVFPGGVARGEL